MRQYSPSNFLGRVRVVPNIPERLAGLADLSKNLWWCWSPVARRLFRQIDTKAWIEANGNPVRFLLHVPQGSLDAAATNKEILAQYDKAWKTFRAYMDAKETWFTKNHKAAKNARIAYFSFEYGLHHTLPNYSGGLGVLAGDHLKSASDLGIPLTAFGLLYREGYFTQDIDADGNQKAIFDKMDWENLPVTLMLDDKGQELRISVELAHRNVEARLWEAKVGRVSLYYLDTDIAPNSAEDRRLTARLYGGDVEHRIQQEILLGIGGVRAARLLGLNPTVFHMNEGHSVFLALERLREYVQDAGLSVPEAIEAVRAAGVFTTHTPVPAGNDVFTFELMDKYFYRFYQSLGMNRTDFMELGYDRMPDNRELFSVTALALRLSGAANGVSEIHGHVARKMWAHLYRDTPPSEAPIGHITNGVHTQSWMDPLMQDLLDKHLPADWRARVMEPELWKHIDKIPDKELHAVTKKLKEHMVEFVHERLRAQHLRYGESPDQLRCLDQVFSAEALTIGFARRFATYKRATLIFRDKERLRRILNNPDRPVQIVFSGKAHPADTQAQQLIREIQMIAREDGFRNKIAFIENYDINVAHRLTGGVDVWLNNPRRPLEASGTSGMKVPLNGGLNCSILDGWWPEALRVDPNAGWAIGEEKEYANLDQQDSADAESLYHILEDEIIPMYYDRDANGVSKRWMERIRASMITVAPLFSTDRMVSDYLRMYYLPATERSQRFEKNDFADAKEFAAWKQEMRAAWHSVRIHAKAHHGDPVQVNEKVEVVAEVELGRINPKHVSVEIYTENLARPRNGNLPETTRIPMKHTGTAHDGRVHVFKGQLQVGDSGEFGYTVRVVPKHDDLSSPAEIGLVRWA